MKYFILSFFIAASSEAVVLSCNFNGELIDLTKKNALQGKTGTVSCADKEGNPMRVYEVQNGKEIGKYMFIDVKGNRHEFTKNASGKMHGEKKEYYKNGSLASEETYSNGVRVGLLRKFFDNGNPQVVLYSYEGPRVTFSVDYRKDGTVRKLICGKDSNTIEFSDICGWNGPREVDFGTKKVTFLDGKELETPIPAKPAAPMPKADPADSAPVAEVKKAVVKSPELPKMVIGKKELKQLEFYYETGAIASEGIYIVNSSAKPIPHGQVKTYWPSGKPKSDCYFKEGKKYGDCLIYNEKGEPVKKSTYEDDVVKKEINF